jgi:transglutaminase-like putative cysteine protease
VLPNLRTFNGTMGTPLAAGDQGVSQTIDVIRQLVDDAVKDPAVNVEAIGMVRGVDQFNRDAKAHAIFDAVASRFYYVEDPVGPLGSKETLRPVRALLQTWAGDCDDASVLIASLLGTIGIPSRVVTIAADPSSPEEFSHIYPEAETFPDVWMPMDIARPGSSYGSAPAKYFRKRVWSLTDRAYQDLNGRRSSSLAGYAMLGDDSSNAVAQDISAIASLAPGVAQDINAAEGPSYVSPYASFYPAGQIPPAGYPSSGTVTASLSGGGTPLIVIGGFLLLAVLLKGKI